MQWKTKHFINVLVVTTRIQRLLMSYFHAYGAYQRIAHYWQHRGDDRLRRSKQLLIDFLCSVSGGPVFYMGRDMLTTHKGMNISEPDWAAFMEHVDATLEVFKIPQAERDDLVALIEGTKADMVEA